MGIFIQIELDQNKFDLEAAKRLISLCPVDIFVLEDERLTIRSEQEDECTLCELCLDVAPAEALTIRKTYKDELLKSRG